MAGMPARVFHCRRYGNRVGFYPGSAPSMEFGEPRFHVVQSVAASDFAYGSSEQTREAPGAVCSARCESLGLTHYFRVG